MRKPGRGHQKSDLANESATYVLISIMLRDEFNTWQLVSSNLAVVRRSSSQWNIRRSGRSYAKPARSW